MKMLDGHAVAKEIHEDVQKEVAHLKGRKPCLACVLTTDNPASLSYVRRKVRACQEVGIHSKVIHFAPHHTQDLLQVIDDLNFSNEVDGILIQLPLPPRIDLLEVLRRVDPKKDVDGFHPMNVGKVLLQDPTAFVPCTPLGIKVLLQKYEIPVDGQHVVILGRSNIVGKPLATLFMQDAPGCNATVTIAHTRSKHIKEIARSADILITAIGKAHRIGPEYVKDGAVVVDVGINKIEDSSHKSGFRVVGDVDFEHVKDKCSAITPVPGGVGPMTIAMLLKNTLQSYKVLLS